MKNFLAQEHEKLSLWWAAISAKEITLYLLLTLALLLPVYLYYAALGITGLTEWYRCLRNFAECGLLFFLTELVTRRSLLHPFWRIGYIPFFSWILIFPYVLTHAVNGMTDASFNHLSPYFLTAMAILLLLFFVMNVISRVYVGKRLATLICLALVCFFTFNAFIFLTLALAFTALYAKWIYRSAYRLSPKWIPKNRKSYSVIHRMLQFLVFFGCLWLFLRWASECFPLHDYEAAKQYNAYIEYIKNTTL